MKTRTHLGLEQFVFEKWHLDSAPRLHEEPRVGARPRLRGPLAPNLLLVGRLDSELCNGAIAQIGRQKFFHLNEPFFRTYAAPLLEPDSLAAPLLRHLSLACKSGPNLPFLQ